MSTPEVTIIGGGIGGLSAAVALQQRGIRAEVYEAAEELRPVGAGIWVPSNAMQVLHRLGLSGAVEAEGIPLERIQLRDLDGTVLQEIDLRQVKQRFGQTTVSIYRADLQRILAERLEEGTLHLGRRLRVFEQDAGGVTALFHDGRQSRAELLVGADGIHSAVRRQLFPRVSLRYSGQTCYRALAEVDLPPELERSCWEVWGGNARFGFSAVGPGRVYWYAPVTAPAGGSDAPDSLTERLMDLYSTFPSPIPRILAHTAAERVIRTDLCDFPPIDRWSEGKVVLLGDAAHAATPNLGQGGAQAIEDAWVLAACLGRHRDLDAGLVEYQRIRRPRANRIVNLSRQMGRAAHLRNPWARTFRNWGLRSTPASVRARQLEDLYSPSS